jgi:hypothetical protein
MNNNEKSSSFPSSLTHAKTTSSESRETLYPAWTEMARRQLKNGKFSVSWQGSTWVVSQENGDWLGDFDTLAEAVQAAEKKGAAKAAQLKQAVRSKPKKVTLYDQQNKHNDDHGANPLARSDDGRTPEQSGPGRWHDQAGEQRMDFTTWARIHLGREIKSVPATDFWRQAREECGASATRNWTGADVTRRTPAEMDQADQQLLTTAGKNGLLMTAAQVADLWSSGERSNIGFEHNVVLLSAENASSGYVLKSTKLDMYGIPDRSAMDYVARLDRFNRMFPQAAVEIIGVIANKRGNGVIITAQPFIVGQRPTLAQIIKEMAREGYEPIAGIASAYRHRETGIELYDAHEDNSLYHADLKRLVAIDLWINDPQAVIDRAG